ncbi:MAG: GDP-mannose 4,6-dehydratase [Acidobacteria bacterium]|nr:GDP-mannose 4,6-dehydratase [Acidobacteriota bacterium]
MRALITGGAGFIGSHLAEALLQQEHDVWIVDDLSTGAIENIQHLKAQYAASGTTGPGYRRALAAVAPPGSRFQYTIDTVLNVPLLAELVDQCDVVYHLAAAVGVRLIVESPVRTIETNVRGTEVVLELANKKKKKVFVASTSEVYGKASKVPFSEDDDLVLGPTVKGRWAYACSKALDEFLALAYCKEKGLPVVVVRLFNTVGPRQTGRYGMVLPNFVRQAVAGDPITVYGDGKQTRSFTYVGDVVEALIQLVSCEAATGEVFNVGSQGEVTIEDLARRVKAATASRSEIQYLPYDQAYAEGFEDMPRRLPDISKIRRTIGWEPKVSLEEIIQRVVDDHRRRL